MLPDGHAVQVLAPERAYWPAAHSAFVGAPSFVFPSPLARVTCRMGVGALRRTGADEGATDAAGAVAIDARARGRVGGADASGGADAALRCGRSAVLAGRAGCYADNERRQGAGEAR